MLVVLVVLRETGGRIDNLSSAFPYRTRDLHRQVESSRAAAW